MYTSRRNSPRIPFKPVSIASIFFSLLFIFMGVVRFFDIDFVLKHLPETTREAMDDVATWVYYFYLIVVLTNLQAVILLNRRSLLSVPVSQISATGMLFLMAYHFFTVHDIYLYVAVEMIITLGFYVLLAWFATYARRNGELIAISSKTVTIPLRVQEGCNHSCAYCPKPLRKGHSRSDKLKNIVANATSMAEAGIKDILLVGDNVGDFGSGENGDLNHEHTFLDMLKELDKIGDVHSFRVARVTTPMFSDKTLKFIKNSTRFVPYFSIKMESGSDAMLEKMNRPFPLKYYRELYVNIKKLMPDAFIIVDIIVGFPGETDALFQETVDFIKEMPISYITPHAFDPKIGTKAFLLKDGAVKKSVRRRRRRVLIELSKQKLRTFYESQLGKEKEVLFENVNRGGFVHGYTDNHVKVKAAWRPELGNSVHKIKLTGIEGSFMKFECLDDEIEEARARRVLKI